MDLRRAQAVCVAMVGGILAIAAACAGLAYAGVVQPVPALTPPLAGVVALSLPASVLIGAAVGSSLAQQARMEWLRGEAEKLEPGGSVVLGFEEAYARASLLRVSLIEGFGLIGAISALLTGQMLFLVAPAVAVVGMGLAFPTEAKFRVFVDCLSQPATEREQRLLEATRT